jgi:hypothetical protein
MAALTKQPTVISERQIRVVKKPGHADQATYPAAEAIIAGAMIRLDTSTGRWTNANASAAGEARATHMAWRTVAAGEGLTGVRGCLVESHVLDELAYDDPVYLHDTDNTVGDDAGTVSVVIGRVVPGYAQTLGNAPDKLLDLFTLR